MCVATCENVWHRLGVAAGAGNDGACVNKLSVDMNSTITHTHRGKGDMSKLPRSYALPASSRATTTTTSVGTHFGVLPAQS